jgi:integrase/recombinase XerD
VPGVTPSGEFYVYSVTASDTCRSTWGRALRLPSVRNRLNERILSEADVHRILTLEPIPRNRTILTLLYASGIRVSELCTLAWRDLQPNGEGGQITVFGKGGASRVRFSCRLPSGSSLPQSDRKTPNLPTRSFVPARPGAFCSLLPFSAS